MFLSLLPHSENDLQLDTGVEIRKDDATSLKVHTLYTTMLYCDVTQVCIFDLPRTSFYKSSPKQQLHQVLDRKMSTCLRFPPLGSQIRVMSQMSINLLFHFFPSFFYLLSSLFPSSSLPSDLGCSLCWTL